MARSTSSVTRASWPAAPEVRSFRSLASERQSSALASTSQPFWRRAASGAASLRGGSTWARRSGAQAWLS